MGGRRRRVSDYKFTIALASIVLSIVLLSWIDIRYCIQSYIPKLYIEKSSACFKYFLIVDRNEKEYYIRSLNKSVASR